MRNVTLRNTSKSVTHLIFHVAGQVFNVTLTEAASAAEDRGAEGEGVQPYSPLRGN